MTAPSTASPPSAEFRLSRPVLAGGFLGFLVSGGIASLYGPAAPAFRRVFEVDAFTSGLPASVHPLVAFAGVFAWALLTRRFAPGRAMAAGAVVIAAGAVGIAAAPAMVVVLSWVVLVGLGFGLLSNAMNEIYPRATGPRTAVTVARMHGAFGLGAVALPFVLASVGYRIAYLVVAVLALAAIPLLGRTPPAPVPPVTDAATGAADRRAVRAIALVFAGYVATEAATATWLATYLQASGWSEAAGARWTSAFWAVFTLARFAVAPLASRLAPGRLVRIVLPLGVGWLLLAAIPPLAPYAFLGAGICFAPVFPSAMVWLARVAPTSRTGTTTAVLSAMVGATVGPAVLGGASTVLGVTSIPVVLAVLAVLAAVAAARAVARAGTG